MKGRVIIVNCTKTKTVLLSIHAWKVTKASGMKIYAKTGKAFCFRQIRLYVLLTENTHVDFVPLKLSKGKILQFCSTFYGGCDREFAPRKPNKSARGGSTRII